ncbi:MAG: hypothetical protein IIA59_00600 [Candidatus Marinimicrobia bacterium]|nr:hypothetical protein [Candidatus Neomarinimicrobiota bacterium]
MTGSNLTKNVKVTLVKAEQSSGGGAINSDSVDMQGFEGVVFIGTMVTANASNFASVAQSADDSSFNDLAGTKVTPGDAGDQFMIDIYKPLDRYLRVDIDRGGANTVVGEIFALQYGARKVPVSHGSTIDSEVHVSPAEGTA